MSHIYHYTDLNGFLSILKNGKLWLTNTNSMNDHQEILWFKNMLRNKIDEAKKNEAFETIQTEFIELFWSALIKPISLPHICCFSKSGDLLSQWRAYADDAQGISIGFDKEKLNLSKRFPVTNVSKVDNVYLHDVIYEKLEQEAIVDSIVNRLVERVKLSPDFHQEISMLINECFGYSYIFKNPAFIEESEVRAINLPILDNSNKWFGNVDNVDFRVSGGTLASYFNLSFASTAITKIILGPKSKVNIDDVNLFLRSNDLEHIEVKQSSASYR